MRGKRFFYEGELANDKRIGLALGSGAARGWAHIGVIRALEHEGYAPAWVAGTSMGALVGAMYAAGKLDELEEFARGLTPRKVLSYVDLVVPVRGLLGGDDITDLLKQFFGEMRVDDTLIPFCAVATDLATGRAVRMYTGSMVNAVRASVAIPGVFNPVVREGKYLVDGGLVDPVPVALVRDMGAHRVVAVDLNHDIVECNWCAPNEVTNRPAPGATEAAHAMALAAVRGASDLNLGALERSYRKLEETVKTRAFDWIMRAARPNVFDVIGTSINVVSTIVTRVTLEVTRPEVLVRPTLGHMNLWDFSDAAEAIDEGYQATRRALKGN
ncbi:MAG: patatin-like phospholipase family protein [Nitrospirota bacterium]|nr:patatin-like phospholipase family protein [Nitrospirota bacterium]